MATEPLIYLLTVLLGVSAGLGFALSAAGPHRWLGRSAGLLVLSVVVIAGFILGAKAVWIGPIFLFALLVTNVTVGAYVRRDEPMFLASSYWRRVLLASRGDKSERTEPAEEPDGSRLRIDSK